MSGVSAMTSEATAGDHLDVVVVGGCGHVGLPLAIAFADRGLDVGIYDINEAAVKIVESGELPFQEPDAHEVLQRALDAGRLTAGTDPAVIADADVVVVVIGTPVDEHLNPDPHAVHADPRARRSSTSATASCSCCAAPSTRA